MSLIAHRHSLSVVVIALAASAANATQVVTTPFLGVRRIHQTETSPRPLNINVVEIDLSAPGINFMMTPRGPGPPPVFGGVPDETVIQTTRQFTDAVGAQVAINASFYAIGAIHYHNGMDWTNNQGLTASNGDAYSPWESPFTADFDDALNITQSNQARIVKMPASIPTGFETNPPVTLYNTVTGSHRLVQNGASVAPASCGLCGVNPRTAVGLTAGNGKLLMVTVDGRQNGFSEGVTLMELANLMISHGAVNAINLDGGGSTTMVMNHYDDALAAQVLNSPSDGGERRVGTNLGVFAYRSGDINGDGIVDTFDSGDFNRDGVVDTADYVVWRKSMGGQYAFNVWKSNFGITPGGGSGAGDGFPVPEPSLLILATLTGCILVAVRSPKQVAWQ